MNYEKLLEAVQELGFIPDPKTADAAVKAVLGILASAMNEDLAREFTESLPGPLTYDRLRGHQAKPLKIDADGYIGELAAQFRLPEEQARLLIAKTLALARGQIRKAEEALERGKWADLGKAMEHLKKTLPPVLKEDSPG